MTIPAPQTIAQDISRKVVDLLDQSDKFLTSDMRVTKLLHEAGKVQGIDAAAGMKLKAAICVAQGNPTEANRLMKSVALLTGEDGDWVTKVLGINQHFLLASVAQQHVAKIDRIPDNELLSYCEILVAVGAFSATHKAVRRMDAKHLKFRAESLAEVACIAHEVLGSVGITDSQCARVLDAAGEVLRAHQYRWHTASPRLTVDRERLEVALRIPVRASVEIASNMNNDLAELLIDRELDTLPFFVAFRGEVG